MFGLWRKKHPQVYSHWYVLWPDFQSSIAELYGGVLEELERRQVPGLDARPANFFEGGMLTRRRTYLRLRRERIVFDVCSAPFGTAWFFSCRIGVIPFSLRVWEFVVMGAVLFGVFFLYPLVFGLFWGPIVFGASVLSALMLLNTYAATGTRDLDSIVHRIPVLGSLYELFVRRNQSYYREDTRLMYAHVVDEVVRQKVAELGAANGIEEVEFHDVHEPVSPKPYHEKILSVFAEDPEARRVRAR